MIVKTWLPITLLVWGVLTFDPHDLKWGSVATLVFAVPFFLRFFFKKAHPAQRLLSSAQAIALALVFQTLVTPLLLNDPTDYLTGPPSYRLVTTYQKGALAGIRGTHFFTTDTMGFRVWPTIDYDDKKELRVFAIGGSTTQDAPLDDQKTWTHLLQRVLQTEIKQPLSVVNTGVSGLFSIHHVATLRRVVKLKPDLVVLLIGVNDWNRDIQGFLGERRNEAPLWIQKRFFYLRNSMVGMAYRQAKAIVRTRADTLPTERLETGAELAAKRGSLFSRGTPISYFPESVSDEYRHYLLEFIDICHQAHVPCLIANQPNAYDPAASEEHRHSFWMTPPDRPQTLSFESLVWIASLYNRFTMQTADQNGVARCDPAGRMRPTATNFYDEVHFTEKGAERVANELGSCILAAAWRKTL